MLDFLTNWKDKVVEHVNVRFNLVKLNFIERTSNVLSYFIFTIIAIFLVFTVIILGGLGLAEWFSYLFNSRTAGFFAAMGACVLILLILMGLRKAITNGFSNAFIKMLTAHDDDEDDEQTV